MTTPGDAAARARTEVRQLAAAKGHPTDNARRVIERLEHAFVAGELQRTELLDQAIQDLQRVLAQADGQRLGGKSGEAARFILRAIVRRVDEA
jgi:hypothetical protein